MSQKSLFIWKFSTNCGRRASDDDGSNNRMCGGFILLIWLFATFFPLVLPAQVHNMVFDHLSLDEGLSQSSVLSISQDGRGFIWLATQEGLNRYDGYNFTIYKHISTTAGTLTDNWINVVFTDRQGVLWVGTASGGLNRYDDKRDRFISYRHDANDPNSLSSDNVTAIYEDRQGRLWIGTNGGGINRLDEKTGNIFVHEFGPEQAGGLSSDKITAIAGDRHGNLWVATADAGLNCLDVGDTGDFHCLQFRHNPADPMSLSEDRILSLRADSQGVLWLGTDGGGLDRLSLDSFSPESDKTPEFQHYRFRDGLTGSLSDDHVYTIFEDSDGALWIGTDGGLNQFLPEKNSFLVYRNNPSNSSSLSYDFVRDIYEDQSGILWVATFGGGLNKFDKKRAAFTNFSKNPSNSNSLTDNTVWAITKDNLGNFWVGTNNGLNKLATEVDAVSGKISKRGSASLNGRVSHYFHDAGKPRSLSHDVVRTILQDGKGDLWVGTDGGGLNKYDRREDAFVCYKHDSNNPFSLSDNRVRALYEDRRGSLWIATWDGLDRYDRQRDRFTRFQHHPEDPNSLGDNRVRTIYEDRLGALWIGTYGGLYLFDKEKNGFIQFQNHPENGYSLSNDRVLCIYEDTSGRLWIGTYGGGLNLFDREEIIFTHFTMQDGLPNDVIYGVLEDARGYLWLSTNRGISRFDPQSRTFRNYDEKDGLQSNEFNGGAYFQDQNGMMYFGGINGFTMFDPEELKENMHVPPIVLTDFKKYGRTTTFAKSLTAMHEIQLSYKEDFFSLEFAALDFANPDKNQYAYKLEGFDKDWINSGNRRFASYTNLDGGTYTFRVKGSNNNGVWNEKGLSIKLIILPPFWQTWWFRIALGLIVFLLVYAIHRLRVRNINAQKRILAMKVAQRTDELNQRHRQLVHAKKETDDILNNVEEGLFLLNKDYEIGEQYSAALPKILRQESLTHKNFLDLLGDKIPEHDVRSTEEYLGLMFREDVDETALMDLNPLSEIEFQFSDQTGNWSHSRFLAFNFRRITDEEKIVNLIATVEDQTEQVLLTQKLKQTEEYNQRQAEWLVSILHVEPPTLKEFMEGVEIELDYIDTMLRNTEEAGDYRGILENIYRSMHLIKGNAALLDLKYFKNKAHEFEDKINEINQSPKIEGIDFVPLVMRFGEIQQSIREIKKFIARISRFHDEFRPTSTFESELLMNPLRGLVKNLAHDLDKEVRLDYEQFDTGSIPYRYRLLVKEILVQFVRNTLFHGIESPDERSASGKERQGLIRISSRLTGEYFVLIFHDDGQGIQVDRLREMAASSGDWSADEVNQWDERQVADLIFRHGISTSEHISMVAGRGVGMDAVKQKLDRINANIEVDFEPGRFCEFRIYLPLTSQRSKVEYADEARSLY